MPIFLTVEQIHDLLDLAARNSARDYAILRLMANTGLRESDVLALKRQHILTNTGEVVRSLTVKMKKTGKTVEKTISDPTREAIAAHLRSAPKSPWLFPGEFADKPLTRRTLHRIFKRHMIALLGDEISLRGSATHTLRRSVAFLVSEKHGIESASVFLGHNSLQNTIFYLNRHKLQQRADEVIKDMDL